MNDGRVPQRTVQPNTSISDLWELLTTQAGHNSTHLAISDVVDLFARCLLTGLDSRLPIVVPQSFQDEADAMDISPGDVSHICMMLTDSSPRGVEIDEGLVREELQLAGSAAHEHIIVDHGACLAPAHFRRLIRLISNLMRIEEQYIVMQMVWIASGGRFEPPAPLVARVMERCALKIATTDTNPSAEWLLEQHFSLEDLQTLCIVCCVTDEKLQKGPTDEEVATLFETTVQRMRYFLSIRADGRPGSAQPRSGDQKHALSSARSSHRNNSHSRWSHSGDMSELRQKGCDHSSLVGQTELAIFWEKLFQVMPESAVYRSPLDMLVIFLQRASPSGKGVCGRLRQRRR